MARNITLAIVVGVLAALVASASMFAQAAHGAAIHVYVDCSGSMAADGKSQAAREGAKLFVAMGENSSDLVIVPFNHTALIGKFSMPRDRDMALKWIDAFRADGGTDYLTALKVAELPPAAEGVFLSDGGPNSPPAEIFQFLKAHCKGKLHTVAIDCPAGSPPEKLLMEMAALTGGSFTNVENSEALVTAMLALATRLGRYRSHRPDQDSVQFRASTGRILAFGYDGVPEISASPTCASAILRHHAALPEQKVDLAALDLTTTTDVTLRLTRKRTATARLGDIHRSDLPEAHVEVETKGGRVAGGDTLKATVRFIDRDGHPVPPNSNLSAEVQILDPSQKVLSSAVANPSPDRTKYQAQVAIPSQPGTVTLRTKTAVATPEGHAFIATDDRTVVVANAYALAATPVPLQLTAKLGQWQCPLDVRIVGAPGTSATFSAELPPNVSGLRLLTTTTAGEKLVLQFEATAPGTHRGSLLLRANAPVLTKSLAVPFVFTVEPLLRGLALPTTRQIDLGSVTAQCGLREVALHIPSLDDQPAAYDVQVRDLAGSAIAIPLKIEPMSIQPSKNSPAEVKVSFHVEDIPTGTYLGAMILKPTVTLPERSWETKLRLLVSEPLSAPAVDAGIVEVGKIVTRTLTLTNLGAAGIDGLTAALPVTLQGPAEETRDIAITLVDEIGILAPNQSKPLALRIAVSPLMASRGAFQGRIRIRRGGTDALAVPFSIKVVSPGEGPSPLVVAPEAIEVSSAPGEVAHAQLRIRLESEASEADELEISGGAFHDAKGASVELTGAFRWPDGNRVTPDRPVTTEAFLVSPPIAGTYRGTLTIRSQRNGTKGVPVTLRTQ
jgi:hypothetical protein